MIDRIVACIDSSAAILPATDSVVPSSMSRIRKRADSRLPAGISDV
jgi:hypothetical protein